MTKTKESVVCIFAHPDDESFGCAGTIAKFSKTHNVYIVCATNGDAGENHHKTKSKNLAAVRKKELRAASKILGVKHVYFLNFDDGTLSNSVYHKLSEAVKPILEKHRPATLITIEPRGISGHIDHITVSMVTSYLFERLPFAKKLMYFCLTESQREKTRRRDYFIYIPPGYKKQEIGETIDVSSVWDARIKAIRKHKSQLKDANFILSMMKLRGKKEHFLVKKKA